MSIAQATPQPARHPSPSARASALAHLVPGRSDFAHAPQFHADFGLAVAHRGPVAIYLHGTAPTAYCYRVERSPQARLIGVGLRVDTQEELQRLAQLDGASPHPAGRAPGGWGTRRATRPFGVPCRSHLRAATGGRAPAQPGSKYSQLLTLACLFA